MKLYVSGGMTFVAVLWMAATPPAVRAQDPAACDALSTADRDGQVQIVESTPSCASTLVGLLVADPASYVDAFGTLISSSTITESLFFATYEELRQGRMRFDREGVDLLLSELPSDIAACQNLSRCGDWNTFILSGLQTGGMFQCPDVAGLSAWQLLANLPYGDYNCTEAIAGALGALEFASPQDEAAIQLLILLGEARREGWSRRNALRALGRLAERPEGSDARRLVLSVYASNLEAMLHRRLARDRSEDVLHDAIWILDTFFYPHYETQKYLETITADPTFHTSLRFRAARAWSRLIWAGSGPIADRELEFIVRSMDSDDAWVRAEAAYVAETMGDDRMNSAIRSRIVAALERSWRIESELIAQVYVAQALDYYNGSDLRTALRTDWEATHLGSTFTGLGLTIRSGLSEDDLPTFATTIENTRAAFFDILGSAFATPVPEDTNAAMTLFLFGSRDRYSEYMSLFVGYGQDAGGLYLENEGALYTYQRTPAESIFTVEELIQHEYSHYLQGRYVYPGLWADAGYHDQPKGWLDEGLAEVLAGAVFEANGAYSLPVRPAHLSSICSTPPALVTLLERRAGYDQTGTFDYPSAWAFSYFLTTGELSVLRGVAGAYRDQTYQLTDFRSAAGRDVPDLEQAWHAAIPAWCATSQPVTRSYAASISHQDGPEPILHLRPRK